MTATTILQSELNRGAADIVGSKRSVIDDCITPDAKIALN